MKKSAGSAKKWKPDASFRERVGGEFQGVIRVREALKAAGLEMEKSIVTSRDPKMAKVVELLRSASPPAGLNQWQLPVLGSELTAMYFLTVAAPKSTVPAHAHRDDRVFRLVISGSISFNGVELTGGDWMHVPAGVPYGFTAGDLGCVLLHVYH
jgi:quercetin dioxygenase-like cupin family protein